MAMTKVGKGRAAAKRKKRDYGRKPGQAKQKDGEGKEPRLY